jgi:hypothetical protein
MRRNYPAGGRLFPVMWRRENHQSYHYLIREIAIARLRLPVTGLAGLPLFIIITFLSRPVKLAVRGNSA